jgi:ABC-type uncharacterized transport system permease subunit
MSRPVRSSRRSFWVPLAKTVLILLGAAMVLWFVGESIESSNAYRNQIERSGR